MPGASRLEAAYRGLERGTEGKGWALTGALAEIGRGASFQATTAGTTLMQCRTGLLEEQEPLQRCGSPSFSDMWRDIFTTEHVIV